VAAVLGLVMGFELNMRVILGAARSR
jgi:hypothetical protein